jgi:hypothetical protein
LEGSIDKKEKRNIVYYSIILVSMILYNENICPAADIEWYTIENICIISCTIISLIDTLTEGEYCTYCINIVTILI